jgi:hypothetical protein
MTEAKERPQPILVVANSEGYYNLRRRKVGDRFHIRSMNDIGKWMDVIGVSKATVDDRQEALPEDEPRGPVGDLDVPPDPKPGVALSSLVTETPQSATSFFGKKTPGKAKDGL